ncbi:MAG: helix-turn-helix transcriptional regulator, partial [Lawsonibacter sp.]
GIRLQGLRKQKDISLKALSEQSGVPVEWLRLLEQGVLPEDMLVDHVISLARALNCRPHELFE